MLSVVRWSSKRIAVDQQSFADAKSCGGENAMIDGASVERSGFGCPISMLATRRWISSAIELVIDTRRGLPSPIRVNTFMRRPKITVVMPSGTLTLTAAGEHA
jgi:hypothetical protein